MSRYRKIEVSIWNEAWFRVLSDEAKLLYLHLRSSPLTVAIPGVIVSGPAGIAEVLGWPEERFRERFAELLREPLREPLAEPCFGGVVKADFRARIVWLPRAMDRDPPANPNAVKSWAKAWEEIPESSLKHELWQAVKPFAERFAKQLKEPFAELFPEPFPEPFAEQDTGTGTGYTPRAARGTPTPLVAAPTPPAGEREPAGTRATPSGSANGRKKPSRSEGRSRRGKRKPDRPPLPYSVDALVSAFGRGAGDAFDGEVWDDGLCKPLTALVRQLDAKGIGLADVEAAGLHVAQTWSREYLPLGVKWLAKTGALLDAIAKARRNGAGGNAEAELDPLTAAAGNTEDSIASSRPMQARRRG